MLQKLLKTSTAISRIEGYDVANVQGKEATGSMVVFIKGVPEPAHYRKFKVRGGDTPNDVAMLAEIFNRRFRHDEWQYPDMLFVDGGKAQLSAAVSVVKTCGCVIPVVAFAKGRLFEISGRGNWRNEDAQAHDFYRVDGIIAGLGYEKHKALSQTGEATCEPTSTLSSRD